MTFSESIFFGAMHHGDGPMKHSKHPSKGQSVFFNSICLPLDHWARTSDCRLPLADDITAKRLPSTGHDWIIYPVKARNQVHYLQAILTATNASDVCQARMLDQPNERSIVAVLPSLKRFAEHCTIRVV